MITLNKRNSLTLAVIIFIIALIIALYFIFLKPRPSVYNFINNELLNPSSAEQGGFEVLDDPVFKTLKAPDKLATSTDVGRENPFMELQ